MRLARKILQTKSNREALTLVCVEVPFKAAVIKEVWDWYARLSSRTGLNPEQTQTRSRSEHRHLLILLLHRTSQMLRFLQTEGSRQPCVEHVYWHHFPDRVCSLCVSVSYFGNSCIISNFFHCYHIRCSDL